MTGWLALQSEYRDASGSPPYNPFEDRQRQEWKRRTTNLTAEQIKRWIEHASYHAHLALPIAALNPKFRLENVLQTEWSDIDFAQRTITIWDHKTDDRSKALVSTIPTQLENILKDARLRHPVHTPGARGRARTHRTPLSHARARSGREGGTASDVASYRRRRGGSRCFASSGGKE